MRKFVPQLVFLLLLFVAFLCVPEKEGRVSFAVGNLWTTFQDPDIDGVQLQHIRFWSRYAPPPPDVEKEFRTGQTWHFTGQRWHLGFPCWAFYVDIGTVFEVTTKRYLEPKVWYAKLDFYRLFVNGWVALVAGLVLIGLYHLIRAESSKRETGIRKGLKWDEQG